MKETRLTLPELWLIAATRALLGGGFALLFSDRLTERERKLAGWGLFLVGAASSVPLAKLVFDKRRLSSKAESCGSRTSSKAQSCGCRTVAP